MSVKPGKRPKRRGDRHELIRGLPGTNTPPLFKTRKGKKFEDPEDVLQRETNELLAWSGQFHFRLSAHVLSRAHDASIGGWPDNPLMTRLQPGLSLLGPLELKRPGETLRANQIAMQTMIGTVEATTLPQVQAYLAWYRDAVERIRRLLAAHPLPPLPGATAPAPWAEQIPPVIHLPRLPDTDK